MSEVIVCRSDAEVEDDDVMETHDLCAKALKRLGYTCTQERYFRGLMERCESVILGEQSFRKAFEGRCLPLFTYQWICCHPHD